MIYDTPSNIFNKVDKEKDNSLSLSNIGGIIICLDIVTNGAVDTQEEEEYEKFDKFYSYLTVIREKVGEGKLPPIVLAFTKVRAMKRVVGARVLSEERYYFSSNTARLSLEQLFRSGTSQQTSVGKRKVPHCVVPTHPSSESSTQSSAEVTV